MKRTLRILLTLLLCAVCLGAVAFVASGAQDTGLPAGTVYAVYGKNGTCIASSTDFSGLPAALQSMASGSTLRLYADYVATAQMSPPSGRTTRFDLNGHRLITTNNSSGAKQTTFSVSGSTTVFSVYSSVPGGAIFNRNAASGAANGNGVFYVSGGATVRIGSYGGAYKNNLSTYSAALFYLSGSYHITAEDMYAVRNVVDHSALFIASSGTGDITARNCRFLTGVPTGVGTSSAGTGVFDFRSTVTATATLTVENCDINTGSAGGAVFVQLCNTAAVFRGCRIYGALTAPTASSGYTLKLGSGCCLSAAPALAAQYEGNTALSDYSLTDRWEEAYNVYGVSPDLSYDLKSDVRTVSFTKGVYAPGDLRTYRLHWCTEEGEIVREICRVSGMPVREAICSLSDGLSLLSDGWTDEAGNALTVYGNAADLYTETTLSVTGLRYNLSLFSDFYVHLYVPMTGYLTAFRTAADGENLLPSATVASLSGKQYFNLINTAIAANCVDTPASFYLTFTVDGVDFSHRVDTNIVTYAGQVLQMKLTTAREQRLMMALLGYANEACRLFNGTPSDRVSALLTEHADISLDGYDTPEGTVYPTTPLAGAILSAQLDLTSRPAFVFRLREGFFGTVEFRSGDRVLASVTADGREKTVRLEGMRIYEFDRDIRISVTPATGTPYSGTYNLATYADGVSSVSDFMRAMFIYVRVSRGYKTGTVAYSEFGAVGDGVTDDFDAIRKTHDYANATGLKAVADKGACYYIGIHTETVSIRTDTDWGDASFIIDDRGIASSDPARYANVFRVDSDYKAEQFTGITSLSKGQTNIGMTFDHPYMLYLNWSGNKVYIRYGGNANSGSNQQEIILVDEEGNIDPTTPILWDYGGMDSVTAYRIDDKPITVEGGIFTTRANCAVSASNYYARGIQVSRSNTTLYNIKHYITDEGDTGCPYTGFYSVQGANNVEINACVMTGHKTYYNNNANTGARVPQGSYDTQSNRSNNVRWVNCTQSQGIDTPAFTNQSVCWGVMASNFCKNLVMDGCTLSRFDAHMGMWNATVKNSTIGIAINCIGGGTLLIENTVRYSGSSFIYLREDYGSIWEGDVIIRNCTFRPTSQSASLISASYVTPVREDGTVAGHWFGYPCCLPKTVTVENLTVDTSAVSAPKIYVFSKITDRTDDISKDTVNPYAYPTSVTVSSSYDILFTVSANPYIRQIPHTIVKTEE